MAHPATEEQGDTVQWSSCTEKYLQQGLDKGKKFSPKCFDQPDYQSIDVLPSDPATTAISTEKPMGTAAVTEKPISTAAVTEKPMGTAAVTGKPKGTTTSTTTSGVTDESNGTTTPPKSPKTAIIIGVVVAVLIVLAIAIASAIYLRRRSQNRADKKPAATSKALLPAGKSSGPDRSQFLGLQSAKSAGSAGPSTRGQSHLSGT